MCMMTTLGSKLFRSFYQALPHRDPFPVWRMYDAKKKTPLGNKKEKGKKLVGLSPVHRDSRYTVFPWVLYKGEKRKPLPVMTECRIFLLEVFRDPICRHATRITQPPCDGEGDQVRHRYSHSSYFAIALQSHGLLRGGS